jgi:hypothetical protein
MSGTGRCRRWFTLTAGLAADAATELVPEPPRRLAPAVFRAAANFQKREYAEHEDHRSHNAERSPTAAKPLCGALADS